MEGEEREVIGEVEEEREKVIVEKENNNGLLKMMIRPGFSYVSLPPKLSLPSLQRQL